MKPKNRTVVVTALGVGLLAGAVYLAASLMFAHSGWSDFLQAQAPGQRVNLELIPAPELPPTQADLSGTLVEVKDNSLMLRPLSKGAGIQAGSLIEVVITGNTKVFRDDTHDGPGSNAVIANGRIQQVVLRSDMGGFNTGDTIAIWGARRGDRLTADVVLDFGPSGN